MKDKKIQWHPGFVAAINLEFADNRKDLEYLSEYNLNSKPLMVDLLVVKKEEGIIIKNEIGRLFRKYNIMEYKSPKDHLDIDTFYKSSAYASLYKSYGKYVDERKADEITVSIIRERKPRKLFKYFRDKGIAVSNPYKGIYYILDNVLFATQIIVTKELDKDNHAWLKALSETMKKQDLRELLDNIEKLTEVFDKELADSVLEVSINANKYIMNSLRGENDMYQVLLDFFEPEITEIKKQAGQRAEEAEQRAEEAEQRAEQAILNTISLLKEFGHSADEIKSALVRNYNLSEEQAENYYSEVE